MKLPSITLSGLQVSDLFFNVDHYNFDVACDQEKSKEEIRAALHLDAIEFCEMIGNQIAPAILVEDFYARL